jgi:hypothetical protein
LYLTHEQQRRRLLNMKKLLLIAALAALTMSMALWGSSITVTSPTGTDHWCIGSGYTVTWTSSGVTGTVDVILRPAGAPGAPPTLGIAAGTANDGSQGWTIPASVAPGSYLVRVRSVNTPAVFGDSANFEIQNCAGPTISVTQPDGTAWCKEKAYTINWTSSGVTGLVDVILRPAGAPAAPPTLGIAAGTANDGSQGWTIPASVATGTYLVRVRSVNTPTVFGDSVDFLIHKCLTPGDMGDWWHLHDYRVEVKWPPDPDPCLCPEWGIKELLDKIKENDPRFIGSLVLFRDGVKLQELGAIGPRIALINKLKPTLSRKNFDAFKNGTAKFTMALLNSKGEVLQQIALQGGAEQLR